MQDDQHIDKLINKAANKHTKAYDEAAWQKMQTLLDLQLPQKQNGRMRIAFLFLLFIVSTTTGIFIYNNKTTNIAAFTKNEITTDNTNAGLFKTVTNINNNQNTVTNNPIAVVKNDVENADDSYSIYKPINYYQSSKAFVRITAGKAFEDELSNDETSIAASTLNTNISDEKENKNITTIQEKETIKDDKEETKQTASSQKKQSKLLQNLALNFSLGPDISFVNIGRPLSAGVLVGGGISYPITKNISLQTGVYLSNKIYSADSANYHPPSSFWINYNNLQNVNATSLVYEFPIAATYNFNTKSKNNLFVSAGVSSYIVKKESYIYSYKNNLGQPDKRNYSVKEKDKYSFSVLTLSAGLQTKPDKKVAYKAEPFIKLPLSGIGFGKINLKSTGIMFSLAVKPFAKKK